MSKFWSSSYSQAKSIPVTARDFCARLPILYPMVSKRTIAASVHMNCMSTSCSCYFLIPPSLLSRRNAKQPDHDTSLVQTSSTRSIRPIRGHSKILPLLRKRNHDQYIQVMLMRRTSVTVRARTRFVNLHSSWVIAFFLEEKGFLIVGLGEV